jgi:hypothetical protein
MIIYVLFLCLGLFILGDGVINLFIHLILLALCEVLQRLLTKDVFPVPDLPIIKVTTG